MIKPARPWEPILLFLVITMLLIAAAFWAVNHYHSQPSQETATTLRISKPQTSQTPTAATTPHPSSTTPTIRSTHASKVISCAGDDLSFEIRESDEALRVAVSMRNEWDPSLTVIVKGGADSCLRFSRPFVRTAASATYSLSLAKEDISSDGSTTQLLLRGQQPTSGGYCEETATIVFKQPLRARGFRSIRDVRFPGMTAYNLCQAH